MSDAGHEVSPQEKPSPHSFKNEGRPRRRPLGGLQGMVQGPHKTVGPEQRTGRCPSQSEGGLGNTYVAGELDRWLKWEALSW